MTQQEYEQKRREIWEEVWSPYREEVFMSDYGREILVVADKMFKAAFDRAYALGKVKDLISQDEIDEAAEDYVSFKKGGKCYPNYIIERACCRAFKDGANFVLGKQEKDTDTVTIDKEEYNRLCKCQRYIVNWVPYFEVCPICGEYNQKGCICANCNNDKNWNK